MPIQVASLELNEPIGPLLDTGRYESIRLLVRYLGRPIGWVWIDNRHHRLTVSPERIRDEIDSQLDFDLVTRTLGQRFLAPTPDVDPPPCTVVICTRDRAELLGACLRAVRELDYPDFEVLVVDNAPSDDSTRELVSGTAARYVREARPGLDWARNRGLRESRGELVAFIDDDARPDSRWLRAIAHAFADPEVMAVTGPVAPLELETRAQILFEFEIGGMMHGVNRRTIRGARAAPRDLLWSSSFVVGTNMAYRRQVFDTEAGFDPALDVGTASGGGGDLEMGHRLVARGHTLVYEPAALVWHVHRRTLHGLRHQLYGNQTGFGSYLLTCMRNRTVKRSSIVRFALVEWLWGWILRRLLRPGGLPRRFVWMELRGALMSPLAYLKARRQARRLAAGPDSGRPSERIDLSEALTEPRS